MATYIKHNDQYYILSSSSLADERIMVLKYGDAFAVFDRFGDIHPIGSGAQGIFFEGTRFVSKLELLIENKRPLLLSSSLKEENEILTVDLTNPDFRHDNADNDLKEKGNLHIHKTSFLWKGACYVKIKLANFGLEEMIFDLQLQTEADFADIFEVRGMTRKSKGELLSPKTEGSTLELSYKGLDNVVRITRFHFSVPPKKLINNEAIFEFKLQQQEVKELCFCIAFKGSDQLCEALSYQNAYHDMVTYMNKVKANSCDLYTSHDEFNNWLMRSKSDLDTMVTTTQFGLYPYAGVPWYSCPFGRDGIITAMQTLWMNPDIAKGVLNFCAQTQAKKSDDFEDAEPGKIFHEKRDGEMANTGEIPFKMYYGTIDATPLFIMLAGMYFERTADLEFIHTIWPNIQLGLEWIEQYGDRDGDGFLEYQKMSSEGLSNQGWKDSYDSIMHEDGSLAEGPIAVCEVQGYVYDAYLYAAEIAEELGDENKGRNLRNKAEKLQALFLEKFWDKRKKTFAIALDGKKQPCRVVSSNAGQCLFTGIALREHANELVSTLMHEKMFTGWGIRTLSSDEKRYNPMSYHDGSVWPHDNSLIAAGMARYGFSEQVHKVLNGLFDMTTYLEHQRLPELFCGFRKRKNEGPTAYPVACSPQSWAIGSVYLLVQACLGLRISAKDNAIYLFKPTLPEFLTELTITNLKVNTSQVVLQVRRDIHGDVAVHILHRDGDARIEIIHEYMCSDRLPKVLERSLKVECTLV